MNPTVLDEDAKAYLEMVHEQVLASNSKVMGEFMGGFASVTVMVAMLTQVSWMAKMTTVAQLLVLFYFACIKHKILSVPMLQYCI
jgi:hypothetical protein